MSRAIVSAVSALCLAVGALMSGADTAVVEHRLPDRIDVSRSPVTTSTLPVLSGDPPTMTVYVAPSHDERLALDPLEPQVIAMQREQHGHCGEWYDEAMVVGWQPSEWRRLRYIIARETGNTCDPTVLNDTDATRDLSYGLMQINMRGKLGPDRMARCGLTAYEDLWDPRTNLACARTLYLLAGWEPWAYTPK